MDGGWIGFTGSTVRRLTSVRGFYYDVLLKSCATEEGRTFSARISARLRRDPSSTVRFPTSSRDRLDLRPPIFAPSLRGTQARIYYARTKNLTSPSRLRGAKHRDGLAFVRSFARISETTSCGFCDKWRVDTIERMLEILKYTAIQGALYMNPLE